MKISSILPIALLSASIANALFLPRDVASLNVRDAEAISSLEERALLEDNPLEKRKGGGGKGGGSSSSGSKSGSSSSSSGSKSGSSSRTSSSSNSGGRTSSGSGVAPAYGGGRYYGGGAAVPYTAGARSASGITPFILPVAALSVFPGLWLYSAYSYHYTHPYTFVNHSMVNSSNPNGVNQTKPVQCLCQQYSECGCDENSNSTYVDSLLGNGSYPALNKSLVTVSNVNGTDTILINGTLANGTTASGGSDSAAAVVKVGSHAGWLVMGALVVFAVNMM